VARVSPALPDRLTAPRARRLWGVVVYHAGAADIGKDMIGPLYTGWDNHVEAPRYAGEPTRPLYFVTKRDAIAWCRAKEASYAKHPTCYRWRFAPVRVTEMAVAGRWLPGASDSCAIPPRTAPAHSRPWPVSPR